MGSLGMQEIIVIFVLALIIFGPRKLPELGKTLGKGLAEFKKASNELKQTWEDEVRLDKEKGIMAEARDAVAQAKDAMSEPLRDIQSDLNQIANGTSIQSDLDQITNTTSIQNDLNEIKDSTSIG
jgi:sec-independent protein translocase protein TatA